MVLIFEERAVAFDVSSAGEDRPDRALPYCERAAADCGNLRVSASQSHRETFFRLKRHAGHGGHSPSPSMNADKHAESGKADD